MSDMLVSRARSLAKIAHINQKYDDGSYLENHLDKVVDKLKEWGFSDNSVVLVVGYLHDIVEDTDVSISDIDMFFHNPNISQAVAAITDESGETRKERKEKTYPKIATNNIALIVKLADRYVNGQGKKFDMYQKEYSEFRKALYKGGLGEKLKKAWKELDELFSYMEINEDYQKGYHKGYSEGFAQAIKVMKNSEYKPLDYNPPLRLVGETKCSKCGQNMNGPVSYYCANPECPLFIKAT